MIVNLADDHLREGTGRVQHQDGTETQEKNAAHHGTAEWGGPLAV